MITSLQHPLVKHLVKLRDSGEYRTAQQRVLIQGSKMVREVALKAHVHRIITTTPLLETSTDEIIYASQNVLDKISGIIASEGIVAEVEMPRCIRLEGSRILALDAVSDPGNLGTLLRTALAFGWHGVYLLPGCCDPFNDKALRAAMGATFKIDLLQGDVTQLQALTPHHLALVADLHGAPLQTIEGPILLVLGNEARGPSNDVKNFCHPVTLPMQGDIESLNVAVAGGILMYLYRTEASPLKRFG